MKVFYSPEQKKHVIKKEVYSGKAHPYSDKVSRVDAIVRALKRSRECVLQVPGVLPEEALTAVHDDDYLRFLRSTQNLRTGEVISPYVFPCDLRLERQEPFLPKRAGYYGFDAGTSLMHDTWTAALASASAAYAAAEYTRQTGLPSYALARPPGHHASRNMFGGYCYLNNAAIAARYLAQFGSVMVIDLDYHHGNGTQSIFYDSADVFYFSIHADPLHEYPYLTGFACEIGIDDGVGYNLNLPLLPLSPASEFFRLFLQGLQSAWKVMVPDFLVISAGFDTAEGDPIGHFHLTEGEFYTLGREISGLGKKTVIVQEGGYLVSRLGQNVHSFLRGFSV